ncbi:tetratricopeptide repeat protein [Oscillatoria sp. FACHB-1406]|uniref:tetratricopeptide repeat protein n=1 Tax=Oscillatoria sp. FACHB-1406 TaxID=2692846 RepID=UPI001682FED4|nr:tetratricopeptide repeat protein [Oscillatoria sp. FACHB-1406]MBD2579915.1 tetratricopeptide repeat protein [Oscillatoria sp. FACHB-1406]
MLDEIAQALQLGDYKTAIRLLKPLIKTDPNHPRVQFYAAQIYEAQDKLDTARGLYRKLLATTTNIKLISQVRQGLQRIETIETERRAQAISDAKAAVGGTEPGVLILEPIASELKKEAAQKFAKIVQLDPYIARLQLPSRGWRLYRTGALGELHYLALELNKAQIPCFSESLPALEKLEVLEVHHFISASSEIVARCQNQAGHLGTISFQASEIKQCVEGRLPLFESVVTVDAKHQLQRKTQTQDYVHFCDLHLLERNCVLRMCDRNYQFQQGIVSIPASERDRYGTVSNSWQHLMQFIREKLPHATTYSDFTPFAETALGFRETLNRISSCINLKRRKETPWDGAFQLYSTLAFLRAKKERGVIPIKN